MLVVPSAWIRLPKTRDCKLQRPCENARRAAKVPTRGREGSAGSMLLSHALAVLCVVLTWLCRQWETRAPCSFHPGVAATGGCKRCPRSRGPTWAMAVIVGLVPAALLRPCARPPAAPRPAEGFPALRKTRGSHGGGSSLLQQRGCGHRGWEASWRGNACPDSRARFLHVLEEIFKHPQNNLG